MRRSVSAPIPGPWPVDGSSPPDCSSISSGDGHRRHQLAMSDPTAGQLVGNHHPRHLAQALEQLTENSLRRCGVSPRRHQHVTHVAVLVDRTPQVMGDAVDLHQDLIDVPPVAGAGSAPAQLGGIARPEPGAPAPDRLPGEHDTAGQQQLLNVAQAQHKTVIPPHRVPEHLDRIPLTLLRCRNCHNDQSWRHHTRPTT